MMDTDREKILTMAMTTLCSVGGAVGYLKKSSIPSLVAGLAFGAMYGYSNYLLRSGDIKFGMETATFGSLVLFSAMLPRAIKTRSVIPISMAAFAAVTMIAAGPKAFQLRK